MRLRGQFYARAVLPLLGGPEGRGLAKRLHDYSKSERRSLAENLRQQRAALVRLLEHAYATSPFYRRRFDAAGVRPGPELSPADLEAIPALTREDLRSHLADICSDRYDPTRLLQAATGGTTDTPVPLLRTRECIQERAAIQWRFNIWSGFEPGDRVFYLWGARTDYAENPSWRWRLYDRTIMGHYWAPTSLLNADVLESYRKSLNEFQPRIIYAYPTPLAMFCEFLLDCGRPYHRPVSCICTAEMLLPQQRAVIEEALGCRVFDHYGSREFGMIAGECEKHEGLHLNPRAAYVESVPVEGAGLNELLVTDLLNYGMPLIRYRINDCLQLGPVAGTCSCGVGYPLISSITGRVTEVFVLPNGDRVPGVALTNRVLQVCPGLQKTQVIQEAPNEFRMRYVPGATFSQSDLAMLRQKLERFFPLGIRWTFEAVTEIDRERSGKTRYCISKVTSAAGRPESLDEAAKT